MDRYVITVAEDRAAPADQALASMHVDLSGGHARVTELTIRAPKAASVDPHQPIIDVLLQALSRGESEKVSMVSAGAEPIAADEPGPRVASAVRATRTRTKRAAKAAPTKRATRRPRQSPAAEGRAYRRMPEPDVVLAAYAQTGTVNGLAGYFGVPQHTVKGWARRLRQMGYQLG